MLLLKESIPSIQKTRRHQLRLSSDRVFHRTIFSPMSKFTPPLFRYLQLCRTSKLANSSFEINLWDSSRDTVFDCVGSRCLISATTLHAKSRDVQLKEVFCQNFEINFQLRVFLLKFSWGFLDVVLIFFLEGEKMYRTIPRV